MVRSTKLQNTHLGIGIPFEASRYFILFLVLQLSTIMPVAASGDEAAFPKGARAAALANAAVTLADEWSFFNNIAGIASLKQFSAGMGYHNRFLMAEWNTVYAMAIKPIKHGVLGLGVDHFGNSTFSQSRLSFGYAIKVRFVSLGVQASLNQISVAELGMSRNMLFQFGGQAELIPELHFGAHITNFNQSKLRPELDERLPTVLKAGLSYLPNKRLMVNAEVAKDIEYPAAFRFGVEYEPLEDVFFVRLGTMTQPAISTAGVGFCHKQWIIDFGTQFHQRLGFSNHLSILFRLQDPK